MSLSIYDAQIFSNELKIARHRKHLTQAECAELLDFSLSFQKDLERGRCSPSLESFYHICRTLNISADACIFPESSFHFSPSYYELKRLLLQCDEKALKILLSTATALVESDENS